LNPSVQYIFVTHSTRDRLWLRNVLTKLGYPQESSLPTPPVLLLFCDNQGTVACTHDPHSHNKMKHTSIREHNIRDCIGKRLINIIQIDGKNRMLIFLRSLWDMSYTINLNGLQDSTSDTPLKGRMLESDRDRAVEHTV
jgi:hypothetical protein